MLAACLLFVGRLYEDVTYYTKEKKVLIDLCYAVARVLFWQVYRNRGYFGWAYRTELIQVSGTGIEFVPNLAGVSGTVLRL